MRRRIYIPRTSIEDVLSGKARFHVACERAETFLERIPDGSVSLALLDPPYHRHVEEAWDWEHDTVCAYLGWLLTILAETKRVLASNGSLYLFAGSEYAGRIEERVRRELRVLNTITWAKPDRLGRIGRAEKKRLRCYFSNSERIIFAEKYGFIHEPIYRYFRGELDRSKLRRADVHRAWVADHNSNAPMAARWFSPAYWQLPTKPRYEWLQRLFGAGFFVRTYEDIREEYERLRRPFYATEDFCADVWRFAPVRAVRGQEKHRCEKPIEMMKSIVLASSRPGDIVLDCFSGSGSTGEAALANGRRFLGCDMDPKWMMNTTLRCQSTG